MVDPILKGYDALKAPFVHLEPSSTNLLLDFGPPLFLELHFINVCWDNEVLGDATVDSSLVDISLLFLPLFLFLTRIWIKLL